MKTLNDQVIAAEFNEHEMRLARCEFDSDKDRREALESIASHRSRIYKEAEEAIQERDGEAFVRCVENHNSLSLVFDNLWLLKERGMLETAILHAFVFTRGNWSNWHPECIRVLLQETNRDKLRAVGSAIPNLPCVVYRGISGRGRKRRKIGLSWTTDLDMACWFALRFDLATPAIMGGTFEHLDQIYFAYDGRDESEILGEPSRVKRLPIDPDEMRRRAGLKKEAIQQSEAEAFQT